MKIAFSPNSFAGGFSKSIVKAFNQLGHQTIVFDGYSAPIINKVFRRINVYGIKSTAVKEKEKQYNKYIFEQVLNHKPDFFLLISGSGIFPETLAEIKKRTKTKLISYVADNPCDPAPHRDKYFPASLRHYDIILNPESVWNKIYKNLAPQAKIIKFHGGYEPDNFYPVVNKSRLEYYSYLECDIAFTGGGYGESPEGAYRAGILGQLAEDGYNVKIWGDKNWEFRTKFYPALKNAIQGSRLSYNELRWLFQKAKIYVNMPSPQIFTSFQPRIFEIAAAKGFQIVDYSSELYEIFNDDVVTFNGYYDLKEKTDYYLKNKKERKEMVEKLYYQIVPEFTWENQIFKTVIKNL